MSVTISEDDALQALSEHGIMLSNRAFNSIHAETIVEGPIYLEGHS